MPLKFVAPTLENGELTEQLAERSVQLLVCKLQRENRAELFADNSVRNFILTHIDAMGVRKELHLVSEMDQRDE